MYGFASASSSSEAKASRRSAIPRLSIAEIVHERERAASGGRCDRPGAVDAAPEVGDDRVVLAGPLLERLVRSAPVLASCARGIASRIGCESRGGQTRSWSPTITRVGTVTPRRRAAAPSQSMHACTCAKNPSASWASGLSSVSSISRSTVPSSCHFTAVDPEEERLQELALGGRVPRAEHPAREHATEVDVGSGPRSAQDEAADEVRMSDRELLSDGAAL